MKRTLRFWLLCLVVGAAGWGLAPAYAANERGDLVVATVGSTKITLKEVDESISSRLFALEQQKYALRKSALDSIVSRLIAEEEARKRGVKVDELRNALSRDAPPITQQAVEEAYRERGDTLAFLSSEEAKALLSLELEKDARLAKYRDAMESLRQAAEGTNKTVLGAGDACRWLASTPSTSRREHRCSDRPTRRCW